MNPAGAAAHAKGIGKGLDVSGNQGRFNWAPWVGQIDFAGIRATSWTAWDAFAADPDLDHNARHTWGDFGGKIPRLFYHYARPGLHNPRVQARLAREVLGGHLCRGDGIVDDMEETDGEPPGFVARWHREFLTEWNRIAEGHRILAYCNVSWAQAGNCAGLYPWWLWLADWGVGDPAAPAPWADWKFLQTSGTTLDRDRFHGTPVELLDFMRMPAWRR